jgi:hypothetical protein
MGGYEVHMPDTEVRLWELAARLTGSGALCTLLCALLGTLLGLLCTLATLATLATTCASRHVASEMTIA